MVQSFLKWKGWYSGKIDGDFGPKSWAACEKALVSAKAKYVGWGSSRVRIAVEQMILANHGYYKGEIDGLAGPNTSFALEKFQNWLRDNTPQYMSPVSTAKNVWPRQSDVPAFYGKVGENQVSLDLPYPMRIAWDVNTTVKRITCHKLVAESLKRIFQRTFDHYGYNRIRELGLDLFGGCLNVRKMRGGKSYSMHSWGIAIDLDPERNQLRMTNAQANFARPEYDAFWAIVEDEGWVSLGRERNYDWMHFQAARL